MQIKNLSIPQIVIYSCVFLLILFAFPYQVQPLELGQEQSWRFIMNFASERDWKFGRDLFFAYGPLNYLIYPYNIGHQLVYSIIIFTLLYGIYAYLVIKLVKEKELNSLNAVAMVAACVVIEPHFITAEIFINQIQMLLIYFIWVRQNKCLAVLYGVLTVVLFHTKYIEYYAALGMTLTYVAVSLFCRRRDTNFYLMIGGQIVAVLSYLVYNPNLYDFGQYLLGMYYISVGQTVDHSYSFETTWEWSVVFVPVYIAFWSGALYWIYKCRKELTPVFLIISSALYFYYKEGFVRHGGYQCFLGMALLFECLCLFINFKSADIKKPLIIVSAGLFVIPAGFSYFTQGISNSYESKISTFFDKVYIGNKINELQMIRGLYKNEKDFKCLESGLERVLNNLGQYNYQPKNRVLEIINTPSYYAKAFNDHCEKCLVLPKEIEQIIGDNTFTAYCSELTYAYTYKNFVVTPGVQNHNAYHPFLDRKNYEFLMGENAPMYVIDNPDITDNRLAEIQSPQTSEALRLNYSYVTKVEYEIKDHSMPNIVALNKLYVRKNTPSGRVAEKEPFISYDIEKGRVITVPQEAEFFTIDYDLGVTGHLARLFWKIPEIFMKAEYRHNNTVYTNTGNIVIDNLSYPTYLYDASFNNMLEDYMNISRFIPDKIVLKGKGMDYIKNIKINFYKGTDYVAE